MKRCVIKNLLFMAGMFLFIFCFLPAKVNATAEEDFIYEEDDGQITITGFQGTEEGDLNIPSMIDGKPVTAIGVRAFYNCSGFTGELTIPDSVTTIGDAAFAECNGFTGSLIIPDGVTEINYYAFTNCSNIKFISVPFSYSECMEIGMFEGCTENIKYKGEFAADFDKNNEKASGNMAKRATRDNILYLPDCEYEAPEGEIFAGWSYSPNGERITDTQITLTEDIILYALWTSASNPRESCTIIFNKGGNDVTGICPENITAKQGEKVTLPENTLERKGYYFVGWMVGNNKYANTYAAGSEYTVPWNDTITLTAKWESYFLYSVNNGNVSIKGPAKYIKGDLIIPKEIDGYPVTEIDSSAFLYCWANGKLEIPDSVTKIGSYAFYNSGLTGDLIIPDSVTEIGAYAFSGCSGFEKLKIGKNVTKIGMYAFYGCSGLTGDLFIPDSVTTIKEYAFAKCTGLLSISVPFLTQSYMEVEDDWDKDIFSECTAKLIYRVEYNVSFNKNNPDATGSMDNVITKGHILALPECGFIAPKGYRFAGWSYTAKGKKITSAKITIDGESKNVTMYALWEKIPVYKITFVGGSGATGKAPSALSGKEKDKVNLPKNNFTKNGYVFVGWTDGKKTYKEGESYIIPAKDVKFTAKWQKKEPTKRELIEQFAERMYTKALGRGAEPDGLRYWADRLEQQVDDGANVAYGFITSTEFKSRNLSDDQFVETMYQTFFDRESDSVGKTYWMNQIKSGASRETVLAGFVKSEEFGKLCSDAGIERGLILEDGKPVNAGIYQFVKRQYTCCLQRDGERDGMDYWATKIAKREVSAVDAAKEFFFSAEFEAKGLSDKQFVERLYETFLGRPFDEIGYAYWNDKMSKGETRREVIDEFAASEEFKGILTSFGL